MALIGVLIRFGYKKALLFLREKNYLKRPKFPPYINCLIYVYICWLGLQRCVKYISRPAAL